jgi:hypothetical protein
VLLEYLLGASEETGHWWKKARTGLQDGRWKLCHTWVGCKVMPLSYICKFKYFSSLVVTWLVSCYVGMVSVKFPTRTKFIIRMSDLMMLVCWLFCLIESHVWLEIKWHYFQLASVLMRFELQQVISEIVYM